MSLEDAKRMAEQFRRFARPRREEPYSEAALRAPIIHIYDVPGGQHCPDCGADFPDAHPDNGCLMTDVYNTHEC